MRFGPGVKILSFRPNASNPALQWDIERHIPESARQLKPFAEKMFRGGNEQATAQKIYSFLKRNVKYSLDGQDQVTKLPSQLLKFKKGDCKSYALFAAGALKALGIPAYIKYVTFDENPFPSHVYVQTRKGYIIDPCWIGFNREKPYKRHYKKAI